MENKTNDYYTVDLLHIVKSLLHRWWIIVLSGFLTAVIGFSISAFAIQPTYSSSILLYVNNSAFSIGNTSVSISSSEITAARSLVNTYSEILNNRTTLERVIERAGVTDYTADDLSKKITSAPANGTEIMRVTVTTDDPNEAAKIANCIAEVLPVRISEIIDGASMEVVDSAVPNPQKVEPSITKYTVAGGAIGVLLAAIIIVIIALLDDTVHNEEYVLSNCGLPILAKVPNLLTPQTQKYGYRHESKRYGK